MSSKTDWTHFLDVLVDAHNAILWPAGSERAVLEELTQYNLGDSIHDFVSIYTHTNGFCIRWLTFFACVEEPGSPTMSLHDVNKHDASPYFDGNPAILDRFFVFADIGNNSAAVLDRADGSIWYESDGELAQTDLTLMDFITTCLRDM
jgi:hypothetical protein